MKAILLLLSTLLIWAQASVSHYDNPNYIVAVLGASSPAPFEMQAWFHTDLGLLLFSSPLSVNQTALCPSEFDTLAQKTSFPIYLGTNAGSPAFNDMGDLYIRRSFGEKVQEFVLPFLQNTAKPITVEEVPELIEMRRAPKNFNIGIEGTKAPYKITIDAGHGGSDPGAVAQGYRECDITLDISIKLRDMLLKDRGLWSIQMVRTSDVFVSLDARTNMANAWPADRFVSIHVNSFSSSSAQGTETYSYYSYDTAAKLRDTIQSEMIKAWGLTNRGSKTENFHVLRETTMPATLSETGFITSPVDIVKLRDPNARTQMAAAHMYALQKHFGVLVKAPEMD